MIYIGADSIKEKLKKLSDLDVLNSVLELRKHKDKLDEYHRHAHLTAVSTEKSLSLFLCVDTKGRKIFGLSIQNPLERNSPIYVSKVRIPGLNEMCEKLLAEGGSQKGGIVRLPIDVRCLAVAGDDDFLRKEIFKEKVYGVARLSFAEKVDDKLFDELVRIHGASFDFAKTYLTNDYILCILFPPHDIDKEHFVLLAEIAGLVRNEMGLSIPASVKPVMGHKKVLSSFAVPYEDVIDGLNVQEICRTFCDKVRRGYRSLITEIAN